MSATEMIREKKRVAVTSVIAAVFLVVLKLFVGLMTNSLGIISEALHSGLDMVAALITLMAVRIADKPADRDHTFGHGKFENLSALAETLLLVITCVWIIYEAIDRLITGETHIEVNFWSYAVIIVAIGVDYGRSRALYRIARKYNSQALEADALHFSTDIWSSAVVLLGLVAAQFGFFFADAVAALVVAFIVIGVSIRLGKRAIENLLDKTPETTFTRVSSILEQIEEINHFHDLRVRSSGADTFVNLNIHVHAGLSIERAHDISHKVEDLIKEAIPRCHVHIHIEPEH